MLSIIGLTKWNKHGIRKKKNEAEMVKYINNYKYDDDETYFYINYFTFIYK